MKVWICSDTHFGHFNIIRYCNRPYNGIEQMDSALIHNWNEVVADDDIVFFLGDFCFAKTAESKITTWRLTTALKGHKIIVKGNHDFKQLTYTELGWDYECYQELVLFDRFSFRHRPDDLIKDSPNFDFIFYGHVHNNTGWEIDGAPINCINVCLDVHNYYPVDITNYFTQYELKELQKLIKNN